MAQYEYINFVIDELTGKELNHLQLHKHPKYMEIWKKSFSNELGRLAQGVGGRVNGTYTMLLIAEHQLLNE